MAQPIRPLIVVEAIPTSVEKGQTIALSARFFDKHTLLPLDVSRIYMTITSEKDGTVVWPLEIVRKNASGFDIMIGTDDMQHDQFYLVRVSNNRNLSPSAATTFEIGKKSTILPIIPLLITPLLFIEPKDPDREVDKYIFRTQMDARVCQPPKEPNCKEHENQEFKPGDTNIPHIPVHLRCRCTMDVIYKDPDKITADMRSAALVGLNYQRYKVPLEAIRVISSKLKV